MDDEMACVCRVKGSSSFPWRWIQVKDSLQNAFSFVQQLAAQRKRKTTSNGRSNVTLFVWSSASRVDWRWYCYSSGDHDLDPSLFDVDYSPKIGRSKQRLRIRCPLHLQGCISGNDKLGMNSTQEITRTKDAMSLKKQKEGGWCCWIRICLERKRRQSRLQSPSDSLLSFNCSLFDWQRFLWNKKKVTKTRFSMRLKTRTL